MPLSFDTAPRGQRAREEVAAERETLPKALGARLIDAGFSGHINSESGHGPWHEGLTCFATKDALKAAGLARQVRARSCGNSGGS
jgi:hypothetical protein